MRNSNRQKIRNHHHLKTVAHLCSRIQAGIFLLTHHKRSFSKSNLYSQQSIRLRSFNYSAMVFSIGLKCKIQITRKRQQRKPHWQACNNIKRSFFKRPKKRSKKRLKLKERKASSLRWSLCRISKTKTDPNCQNPLTDNPMDKLANLLQPLSRQAVVQTKVISISQPKGASSCLQSSVQQTLKENNNTRE